MKSGNDKTSEEQLLRVIDKLLTIIICLMICVALLLYVSICGLPELFLTKKTIPVIQISPPIKNKNNISSLWVAPDTSTIANTTAGA